MNTTTRAEYPSPRTDLVERYVREVGRHLPRARRADVTAELRALVEDQLDDRMSDRPSADFDEVAAELLRELGPPDRVARGYAQTTDVWIGPEYFPAFRVTAIAVLAVYLGLSALWAMGVFDGNIGIVPFQLDFDASRHWFDVLLGAIANVGVITLIFGIVERVERRARKRPSDWDPRTLPKIEDPDRISAVGQVLRLASTAMFALIFNFAPEWLGLFVVRAGEWGTFPVLAAEYRVHLPWLNAFWLAAFNLHLLVLAQGRWRPWSRAAELALGLFGAAILFRIVNGGPFTFLDVVVKPVMTIAMIGTVVVSIVRAVRLVQRALYGVPEPAVTP